MDDTGDTDTKRCRKCGLRLPASCFSRKTTASDGLQSWCKACMAQRGARWQDENREQRRKTWREYRKRTHNRRRYGIENAEYEAMAAAQDGLCPVCVERPAILRVEHDHATGKVRALSCDPCNWMLAAFDDSPDLIEAAIAYLESQ